MFKIGQKVWCAIYGAGVVVEMQHASGGEYPVKVRFNNGRTRVYTSDGKYYPDSSITLFPYPVEIVEADTKNLCEELKHLRDEVKTLREALKTCQSKPQELKPSIDWSHVSSEYNYLVQDSDGEGYLCGEEPACVESGWGAEAHYICANPFTSYVPGTCDWKDSLVERPN